MLATASEVAQPSHSRRKFHLWRSNRLAPTLEVEQEKQQEKETGDTELDSKSSFENLFNAHPSREQLLVTRIQSMTYIEKTLVLKSIRRHIPDYLEVESEFISLGIFDTYLQDLISIVTESTNTLDKKFLFYCYGLVLRESLENINVKTHLFALLELSHQVACQREGIALAIGLASSSHLEETWAVLEQFGQTRVLRLGLISSSTKIIQDICWKWASSTALLCYGEMAVHAKNSILPWVDNIISRMVYYFNCSKYDDVLKSSFLSATVMVSTALEKDKAVNSYTFTHLPDLIDCILISIQKEPRELFDTYFRQKSLQVIRTLSSLQPCLSTEDKTNVLNTCFESLFMLPATEMLADSLPHQETPCDVKCLYDKTMENLDQLLQCFLSQHQTMEELQFLLQHFEPWLMASKPHERFRALQTALKLLQHSQENLNLISETSLAMMGHQLALFSLLWRDESEENQLCARQCILLLIQLLTHERTEESHKCLFTWKQLKKLDMKFLKLVNKNCSHLVKVFGKNLSVNQNTQLILTFLNGLKSNNEVQVNLALEFFNHFLEIQGLKMEQVAEVFQGLYKLLPSVTMPDVRLSLLKTIPKLGQQHTQEVVEVLLSLARPMDSQVIEMWKIMAVDKQLMRKLMTLLYLKMKIRPSEEDMISKNIMDKTELTSIEALNTMYELLYIQEFRITVHWAFPGILLGLLTQLHYLFELDMVDNSLDHFENVLKLEYLSPFRTCLEALKGLFWTTDNWEVFAYMKLQRGWDLFTKMNTFKEGVTLLTRAITHYKCEIKSILSHAMHSMKSPYERDRLIGILVIVELLNSKEVPRYKSRRSIGSFLTSSLRSSNQEVQIMSLQGLGSLLLQPEKGDLLRNQLSGMMEGLLLKEEENILVLMGLIGEILHRLTLQGAGSNSLKVAEQLYDLFDDEREKVRGEAIFLYGDVIYSGGKKYEQQLKIHAFQCLVPLLFHLADPCPEVVVKTKFTFMRLAILFNWGFRKELFSTLAWREGLGAENDIFLYMVESNFGDYHLFLLQAFMYVKSPQKNLQRAAMKFIGGMLQEYFSDLCFYLNKSDVKLLTKNFEALRRDQDPNIRKFYLNYSEDIYELSKYVA
ncbi:maestro heat-like repeat family member 5 [Trichosurus vulpecula]|uniref:maestro heat-like repeat family member 5 n=1 Tax=Trichosurus vulpecula TaxID=9337 RepID=UPI00186AE287|nr:maestro heat-like repeat family member 5 [Trichosurus vulpecula]